MDKDKTINDLKKQVTIFRITTIILFFSMAISAYINITKTTNIDSTAILREEKAKLETQVGIKKCIENIQEATDMDSYSQKVFTCIESQ